MDPSGLALSSFAAMRAPIKDPTTPATAGNARQLAAPIPYLKPNSLHLMRVKRVTPAS